MQIKLELEVNDAAIQQYAGEHLAFVKAGLAEEILCFVINELDMSLDDIIEIMIRDKEEQERGVTT